SPGAGHRSLPHAPAPLSRPRRVHRLALGAGGHDGPTEHALLPGVRSASQRVHRDRLGLRHVHASGAGGRPRALRALDLGDGRGGLRARRDDVRRRLAGAPRARADERSRLSGHHRGVARGDGLALSSLSAVKPCPVDVKPGATAEVTYTGGAGPRSPCPGAPSLPASFPEPPPTPGAPRAPTGTRAPPRESAPARPIRAGRSRRTS